MLSALLVLQWSHEALLRHWIHILHHHDVTYHGHLFTERGVDNREVDIHYRWDDKKNSFIEFKRVNIDEK